MKFNFKVDVYDFHITFTDNKAYADRVTKNQDGKDYGGFYCFEDRKNHRVVILCARDDGDELTPSYLQCLSHECNHAAMSILAHLAVTFSGDSQEALCYLQDYIFGRILNKIWAEKESSVKTVITDDYKLSDPDIELIKHDKFKLYALKSKSRHDEVCINKLDAISLAIGLGATAEDFK